MTVALDTSVILAALLDESGGDQVTEVMSDAVISTVNVLEAYTVFARKGLSTATLDTFLQFRGIEIAPLSGADAESAGRMVTLTATAGLSLGDRACLALAVARGAMVLTADRPWLRFAEPLGIQIKAIR